MSRICSECTSNRFLREHIEQNGENGVCSFHEEGPRKTVTAEELADSFATSFQEFYVPGEFGREFSGSDDDNGYEVQYGSSPREILEDALQAEPEVVDAVIGILQERDDEAMPDGGDAEFGDDLNYQLRESFWSEHGFSYEAFKARVKHIARFVDPRTRHYMDMLFENITEPLFDGANNPIREMEPGYRIFRGRLCTNIEDARLFVAHPFRELVPPPLRRCTAGRMNGAGIRRFYGASELGTCMAELRPQPGSYIVTAQFQSRRALKMFDLTVFGEQLPAPDLFDPKATYEAYARWQFFDDLHKDMTQLVLPTDAEIDYLTTQIAAEYIERVLNCDGLIYRSSQYRGDDGFNIVLFNGMSAVQGDEHSAGDPARPQDEAQSEQPSDGLVFHVTPPRFRDIDGARGEIGSLWQEPLLELIGDTVKTVRVVSANYEYMPVVDIGNMTDF